MEDQGTVSSVLPLCIVLYLTPSLPFHIHLPLPHVHDSIFASEGIYTCNPFSPSFFILPLSQVVPFSLVPLVLLVSFTIQFFHHPSLPPGIFFFPTLTL